MPVVGIRHIQMPSAFPTAMHQALEESLQRSTNSKRGATEWVEVMDFVKKKDAQNYAFRINAFSHSLQEYPRAIHPDLLAKLIGNRVSYKVVKDEAAGVWRVYLRVIRDSKFEWLEAKIIPSDVKNY